MLNKINNLNENGSQLELIAKKGKNNMTNKTKKVNLHNLDQLVNLYNQLEDRGEKIQNISFKDEDKNFKFEDGDLFVWGSWADISAITVELNEDNKVIRRTYKPELSFYSLDDLRITFETVRYIY